MWFARPRRGAPRSAVVYPQAKLPDYFRHGKFTSFQRQLNNFGFRVEKHGATKGACVYTRDDLEAQPAEALLGVKRRSAAPLADGLVGGMLPDWIQSSLPGFGVQFSIRRVRGALVGVSTYREETAAVHASRNGVGAGSEGSGGPCEAQFPHR